MPYTNGDGTYHDRRRCRQLHRTGNRIRKINAAGDLKACPECTTRSESETTADTEEPDEPKRLDPDDAIEAGVCPWCDEYEGEYVASHASSAHPDAWRAYTA